MTSLDTESGSPTVRDRVEAAYASHSSSPDVDSIVNGAVEQRDREIRTRDRASPRDSKEYEGDRSDRLRSTIRSAVHETKLKAASGPTQPSTKHEALAGPPPSWDLNAKAAWHEIPEPVRLAVQREQAEAMNGIETKIAPHLQRLGELEQVLGPARERFQAHGIRSDAEAVHRLLQWEAAIANPQTRVQSVAELMVQNGVTVHDLFALAGASQQYQQYAQHYGGDPVAQQMQNQQEAQAVHQHLAQFSQGKPHFEAVRETMGHLIAAHGERYLSRNGDVNLDAAYRDACKIEGVGDNRSRRAANVSPSSRSPAVHAAPEYRGGGSVRNSIMSAVRQSRGG